MNDWQVGDRVVCIEPFNDHGAVKRRGAIAPQKGSVYTIREVFTEPRSRYPDIVFVRLIEIVNKKIGTRIGPYEAAFRSDRFRKIQPRKTDISVFTKMLNDVMA